MPLNKSKDLDHPDSPAQASPSMRRFMQPVTPSRAQTNRQSQTQSPTDKTDPGANKEGTEKAPFVVKIIGSEPKAQDGASNNADSHHEQPPDWWMIGLTLALVGVGVLQLVSFIIQARRLGDTVNVMKDTAQRQLRAYVSIFDARIAFDTDGRTFRPTIVLQNAGQTPAYDVASWTDGDAFDASKPPSFSQPIPADQRTLRTVVGPGMKFTLNSQKVTEIPGIEGHVRDGTTAIYVWGRVDYRDAFGRTWPLEFRCRAHPLPGGHWLLAPTPEGNDAK
jgi:hypothetical protein